MRKSIGTHLTLVIALLALPEAASAQSVRFDFELVGVRYRTSATFLDATRQATGAVWTFPSVYAQSQSGAWLDLTWRLKPALQNTAYGNALMNQAMNASRTTVSYRHPLQSFRGILQRSGYTLTGSVPVPADPVGEKIYLRLDVFYQDSPTLHVYHDPMDHEIRFSGPLVPAVTTVTRPTGGSTTGSTTTSNVLRWTTPITAGNLGQDPGNLAGVTLQQIVNGGAIVRTDNRRCSFCHYQTSPRRYRVAVTQDQVTTSTIGRTTPIIISPTGPATYTWSQAMSGIVQAFAATTQAGAGSKPPLLEAAFQKWLADGAQE